MNLVGLNNALSNVQYTKIIFGSNISGDVNVTRKVDIDLNDNTLTGDLTFNTSESGTITLDAGTVDGNLTVNTPNVSFINNATVTGTTTIVDVASSTFTNNGTLTGAVVLTDANGTRVVNNGTLTSGLTVNTPGVVNLSGTFNNVTVSQNTTLNLTGTITNLNTNADVIVEGGAVTNPVSGTGTVTQTVANVVAPLVKIENYVTLKVVKDGTTFNGVQVRMTLSDAEKGKLVDGDTLKVSLLKGTEVLATSTLINTGTSIADKFVNEFAGVGGDGSTYFTPNQSYSSSSWTTDAWNNVTVDDKPTAVKVEILRGGSVVSSTISKAALNETFTDADSDSPIAWNSLFPLNN